MQDLFVSKKHRIIYKCKGIHYYNNIRVTSKYYNIILDDRVNDEWKVNVKKIYINERSALLSKIL